MTDQKLVDELEKALADEVYDGGMGALSEDQLSELVRTLASTAAEVVEQAHAKGGTLSMTVQGALVETIGAPPLGNVVAGSVTAEPLGEDQTLVRWVGVAIIPRIQFESVAQVVETETRDRELAEGAPTDA